MKKTLTMVVSILLIAVLLVGCSAEKKIIGSWEGEFDGMKGTFTFEKDGKGEISAEGISIDFDYEIDGKKLKIELFGEEGECEFKVSGSKLTLIGEDGEESVLKKVKK